MESITINPQAQQNLKPARRKLQKNPRGIKSFFSSKRWSQEPPRRSFDASVEAPKATEQPAVVVKQRCVSMAPDLSDAKWRDYLDRASVMSTDDVHVKPVYSKIGDLPPVIPELAHLSTGRQSPRTSLDSSPSSSTSVISASRRQAKTPVFSIGQLEASARRRQARRAENEQASAEAIAEQYRALLESRGHEEAEIAYTASPLEPALPPVASLDRSASQLRRPVLDTPRQSPPDQYPAQGSPTTLSSTSDDGTLVAFQEDAIYFKPVSFSPEASPVVQRDSFNELPQPSIASSRENLSLDISLSLLSRQLSSALVDEPRAAASRDASALQIWVMIEAYEKLQDQLARMNLPQSELQSVTGAIRNWLTALYAVHRSLTDEDAVSESEYGDLEEELD